MDTKKSAGEPSSPAACSPPCSYLPRILQGYYRWRGEMRYKYSWCENGKGCEKCDLANNVLTVSGEREKRND